MRVETMDVARAVFDSFPHPIAIVELDTYRVVAANLKAQAGMMGPASTCYELLEGRSEPCHPTEFACPVEYVAQTWIPVTIERTLSLEGGSARVLEITGFPLRDASGQVLYVALLSVDVTDRRKAQHSEVAHERFKAVGELASVVAHRFNNLLQVVVSGTQVALADLGAGDPVQARRTLEDILASVAESQRAVDGLRATASVRHEKSFDDERADLSVVVGQAVSLVQPASRFQEPPSSDAVRLEESLVSGCLVRGRTAELLELATGIIQHAVDAAPGGSIVRVRTQPLDRKVALSVEHPDSASRDADAGAAKARRAEAVLVPIRLLAERLGGSLSVRRSEEGGWAYVVTLPCAREETRPTGPLADRMSILVIDDDRAVLAAVEDSLSRAGHDVVTAPSGRTGLEILRHRKVDAVVSDFAMPEMDGLEVSQAMKEFFGLRGEDRPAFVLLTGWLSDQNRARVDAAAVDRVLTKPVDPERIVGVIRQLRGPGG